MSRAVAATVEDGPLLSVSTLGALSIELDGERVEHRIPAKAGLLIVYLIDADSPVRRSTVAGMLWSDVSEDRARASLRLTLTRAREVLGDVIHADRDSVWLDGSRRYDATTVLDGDAEDVLTVYRGEFLAGIDTSGASLFDEWATVRRQRLHATALLTLADASERAHHDQRWSDAYRYAQRVVELEPWNESAHRHLIAALAETHGRSSALNQYERCVTTLATELGLEPEPETSELANRIRSGAVAIGAALTRAGPATSGIPVALTPFFGRERELDVISDRLAPGGYRLVTLVGPGGVGKTRLAAEAARRGADRFADGVVFVSLAAAENRAELTSLVTELIAPDAVGSLAEPVDILADAIGDGELLLVLDNFEQLIDSGTELVVELLRRCSALTVLIASRRPLDVGGEDVVAIAGLPIPAHGASDAGASASVRLFVDRGYRVNKSFSLDDSVIDDVVELCRLVEGMPLHLELTAARLTTMTVTEVLDHLRAELELPGSPMRDSPERHHGFDAVFDQSWRTLDENHRRALATLSVTRGGFDEDAAAFLLDSEGTEASHLARSSLLADERFGRFRFHELLRQSAHARLTHDEQRRAEIRHATWYLGMVADSTRALVSRDAGAVTHRLVRDLDNVRHAWDSAIRHDLVPLLARAAIGLGYLFEIAGRYADADALMGNATAGLRGGRLTPVDDLDEPYLLRVHAGTVAPKTVDERVDRWCDRVDDLLADRPDRAADRAWITLHRAQAAFYRGDLADAADALARSERIAGAIDDPLLAAWSLLQRGRLDSAAGRFDEAIASYREALGLFEAHDDVRAQALAHSYLAPAYAEQNLVWKAYEADHAALELSELIGNRQRLADVHVNVGASLVLIGAFEDARRHTATALEMFRASGDLQVVGYVLAQHAECLIGLGEVEAGEHDFVEGIATSRRQGFSYGLLYNLVPWARHLGRSGRYDQAILVAEELVEIAEQRHADHFAITGRALRARSLAATGRLPTAIEIVDGIWGELHTDDPPRLPWPAATLLDLAVVLLAEGDPLAATAVERAEEIHRSTARSITDPRLRGQFLERHPVSIELAALRS